MSAKKDVRICDFKRTLFDVQLKYSNYMMAPFRVNVTPRCGDAGWIISLVDGQIKNYFRL